MVVLDEIIKNSYSYGTRQEYDMLIEWLNISELIIMPVLVGWWRVIFICSDDKYTIRLVVRYVFTEYKWPLPEEFQLFA